MKRTRLRRSLGPPIPLKVRLAVLARDKDTCQSCGRLGTDLHHVTKRSQGGQHEMANLVTLCRACHQMTDWPYAKGRLVVELMAGRFVCRFVYKADKWAEL